MASFQVPIYSPRWGHDDRYTFTKTETGWRIHTTGGARLIETNPDGSEVGAEGDEDSGLLGIMANDSIYPPVVLPFALEFLWKQLNDAEVSEAEAQEAMGSLAAWISLVGQNAPGGYWDQVF